MRLILFCWMICQVLNSQAYAQNSVKMPTFNAVLDSAKYPDYQPIVVRPLWAKKNRCLAWDRKLCDDFQRYASLYKPE